MTWHIKDYWKTLTPEQRSINAKRVHEKRIEREAEHAELKVTAYADIDELKRQIAELTAMREDAVKSLKLSDELAKLTSSTLFRESEIVAASKAFEVCSGVYFLVNDARVVYVGQAVNIHSRIHAHLGIKAFSHFAFVLCPPSHLNILESIYIHLLRPSLNGEIQPGVKHAPISLNDLLDKISSITDESAFITDKPTKKNTRCAALKSVTK